MVDFTDILSKKIEDTEKPKPLPIGTYRAVVQGMPEQRAFSAKDGTEHKTIRFKLKIQSPHDDVQLDQMEEHGPIESWPPLMHDIFISGETGEWNLRQFIEHTLQLDVSSSYGEALAQSPGRPLNVTLKHTPFVNSRTNLPEIRTDIAGTAAV